MSQHIISVQVENKPGVLSRISSMFARRGFNIHSLAVGPTADPELSRMTVVVDGPEMEQVVKQLRKLINTIKVTELSPGDAIEREVMLLRVSTSQRPATEIIETAAAFHAKPVDVGATSIAFEVSGQPEHLGDFLEVMRPFGLVELVKSGRIALGKDAKAGKPAAAAAGTRSPV